MEDGTLDGRYPAHNLAGKDGWLDPGLWRIIWDKFIEHDIQGAQNGWNWNPMNTIYPQYPDVPYISELQRAIQLVNP